MDKKVLILSGSPRKGGNSDILCNQFMQGVKEGGNEAEKIFLGDKTINYCIACETCRGTGKCVHEDDVAEILEKMIAADVIVMASPVYFYTLNAQIKTVIDRTVARYTEITNKELYFIITAADTDISMLQRTVECFRGFADCLDNAQEKGIIYGIGAWSMGDIEGTKAVEEAYEIGKNV